MNILAAHNPGIMTGRGNNTYLLGDLLIDAGVGAPEHLRDIEAALDGAPLRTVVLTHSHKDHSTGLPALRGRWPGLVACAGSVFPASAAEPPLARLAGEAVLRVDARGDHGARSLRVLETPGHCADHICLFDDASGDLFSGDMVIAGTTVLVPPRAKGGSMRDYLASLARLRDLDPRRLLPGHGPVIDRPRERIAEIIEHRLMREAQVAACLADGLTSPSAIVARIYDPLPPGLAPYAEQNVAAHIEKLEDEARVRPVV